MNVRECRRRDGMIMFASAVQQQQQQQHQRCRQQTMCYGSRSALQLTTSTNWQQLDRQLLLYPAGLDQLTCSALEHRKTARSYLQLIDPCYETSGGASSQLMHIHSTVPKTTHCDLFWYFSCNWKFLNETLHLYFTSMQTCRVLSDYLNIPNVRYIHRAWPIKTCHFIFSL